MRTFEPRPEAGRWKPPVRSSAARDSWRAATGGVAEPVPHRARMEQAFGRDFSDVPVHLGRGPALDALGANAATDGERVAFASRSPGPRQVAHELAHVVQMRGAAADGGRLSTPGSPAEREADRIADRAGRGERVEVREVAPAALHRDIKKPDLDVPHGTFKIDMTKVEAPGGKSGETGTIHYMPKRTAPDSDSIRLTQVVKNTYLKGGIKLTWAGLNEADRPALETTAGDRVHVTKKGDTLNAVSTQHFSSNAGASQIGADNANVIRPVAPDALVDTAKPLPAGLTLQICDAVQAGFLVDHRQDLPDAKKRKKAGDPVVTQDYIRPDPSYQSEENKHGHKKGKDRGEASIFDFPGAPSLAHVRWNFETVARSDDIGLYYGTLWWQFEVDSTGATPKVSNEAPPIVTPGATDTFRSAVTEFNRFYANPHTVMKGQTLYEISRLYFGSHDRANDIFKANEKLIGKFDAPLQIGWELRIPKISADTD